MLRFKVAAKKNPKKVLCASPLPVFPAHHSSNCTCIDCSIVDLLLFDETLRDYGSDIAFKKICAKLTAPLLQEKYCPCTLLTSVDDGLDTTFKFICAHIHDPTEALIRR